MGADVGIDSTAIEPVQQILKDTGGRGVDVAIDCGGKDGSINQCINATRNAGRVVVTAIPSEIFVPLAFHPLRRKGTIFFAGISRGVMLNQSAASFSSASSR